MFRGIKKAADMLHSF